MTLSINAVEALWLLITGTTFLLQVEAWIDARRDQRLVWKANGFDLRLIAHGNVRREAFRISFQLVLLAIAVPSVFSDREVTLTPFLALLFLLPILMFLSGAYDRRDRHRLRELVVTILKTHTDNQFEALMAQGVEIRDAADAAYREANQVNTKIADLNTEVKAIGTRADNEIRRTDAHQDVQDDRIEKAEGSQ